MKKICFFWGLLLAVSFVVFGATSTNVEVKCPICLKVFNCKMDVSGTAFGRRLDLKPLGPIRAPWRLPKCPDCHFVRFDEKLSQADLDKCKKIIKSEEYLQNSKRKPYFLFGILAEGLDYDSWQLANIFLKASWEEENEAELYQADLKRCLKHLAVFLKKDGRSVKEIFDSHSIAKKTAILLKGELHRRLAEFDLAKMHFEKLGSPGGHLEDIINFQINLCVKKDSGPHAMREVFADKNADKKVVVTSENKVIEDKRIKWKFLTEGEITCSPVIASGVIYFGGLDTHLYALDIKTGELKWKFKTDKGIFSSPAISSGMIFFGSKSGIIYGLDSATGKEVWKFTTERSVLSSPIIKDKIVYIGSSNSFLYALDYKTGNEIWSYKGGMMSSKPVISGSNIIFGCYNGTLYCLDCKTGEENWVFKEPYKFDFKAKKQPVHLGMNVVSPGISRGKIYTAFGSAFASIDIETGKKVWAFQVDEAVYDAPAFFKDLVFFGSMSGNFYALNKNTGKEVWNFKTKGEIRGACLVHEKTVFFGSQDGCLYGLDTLTGKERFRMKTRAGVWNKPVVIGDTIYFGGQDKYFYAVGLK